MRLISVFYLICIFLCVTCSLNAGQVGGKNEAFFYADSLFQGGNYFESALAFERVYFFASDPHLRARANLGRARALKQTGDFNRARNDLQRSLSFREDNELHYQIMYEMAFCDYMAGNYTAAISMLKQVAYFYGDSHSADQVLLLFALSYTSLAQWDLAKESTVDFLNSRFEESPIRDSLLYRIDELFCECRWPEMKSQKRASNFATFLPGTGHLYAGYPGKGMINASSQLLSLGITGLMAYHNLYVSGFLMGLGMFQSFYFGGIRQATVLTQQRNSKGLLDYKSLLQDFLLEIEAMHHE